MCRLKMSYKLQVQVVKLTLHFLMPHPPTQPLSLMLNGDKSCLFQVLALLYSKPVIMHALKVNYFFSTPYNAHL